MKIRLIVIGLLSMMLCGCQDPDMMTIRKNGAIRIFADSLVSQTRIEFVENGSFTSVQWKDEDKIGLFAGEQRNLPYLYAGSSEGNVEFVVPDLQYGESLKGEEGTTVYAYYPYADWLEEENYTVSLPNAQSYGNVEDIRPFVYAESKIVNKEVHFQFKHIYAYLKLTLTTDIFPDIERPQIENISIISDDTLAYVAALFDLKTKEVAVTEADKRIYVHVGGYDLTQSPFTVYIPVLPQKAGTVLRIAANDATFMARAVPETGFVAGHVYSISTGREDIVELQEQQRQALIDFYNATNGSQWKDNTNWLSDKPIYQWFGVNNGGGDTIKSPYVVELNLPGNNLTGKLPEALATLMNTAESISLSGNLLCGKIPESIRQHPRWNEFGWGIILQAFEPGQGFDMTDINLRLNDMEVEYLTGEKTTLYALLEKYKLVHIMTDTPSDARANQHLSYHNKGFGTVISHMGNTEQERNETYERVKNYPITDMERLWQSLTNNTDQLIGLWEIGSTYLIDGKGYLVDYYKRYWSIPEEFYNSIVDSILYARLGEPEEHPIFSSDYYISSDYSRDGEVITLQEATEGKGIDLVLIGDAYVDRDMQENGKYETDMKKSMELFFSIEPFKTFRNRFNVYAVKVVSATEYMNVPLEKMDFRLGWFDANGEYYVNTDTCFDYVSKVSGVNMDKVTVINVVNNPNMFYIEGYTDMFASGASIAHITVGGPSDVIIHEAGGHGFAKLLDEYIFKGYENNIVSEIDVQNFEQNYKSRGWGANLDVTNSPEQIKWAHFLSDPLYAGETGIYEGAWQWGKGIYRSSENSVMNNDYSWFNAPSREAIYRMIMELSEDSGWVYDYQDFVTYDAVNRAKVPATRSLRKKDTRKVIHKPPTFVGGTWTDNVKGRIPYR